MREVPRAGTVAAPQATAHRHQAPGAAAGGVAAPVIVSIPLVVVLGVVVFLAYRFQRLRAWHALVCLLCGFLLASTPVGPGIQRLIGALVGVFTGH
jgi:hypothetical protein